MDETVEQPKLRLQERNKYTNWVNPVIRQHRGGMIEEFRISFNLDKNSKGAINNWIEFAISKNVRKLELDLIEDHMKFRDPVQNFVFPNKILDRKSGSSTKITGIKFLKTLVLKSVDISDEAIGKILMSCSVLEHLSIYNSGQLVNVKISGPELALTKLEIIWCPGLQSIEIYDSNLLWFKYWRSTINFKVNRVPRLKRIDIGEGSSGIENNMSQQISSCIPYLEVLELSILCPQKYIHLQSLPELPKVKQLKLIVNAWEDDSLLEFTGLLNACPNLQIFVIQLIWTKTVKRTWRERHVVKHPHPHLHLKVVGICGYYGRISDLELALYFIENGIALKKMVIDPRRQVMNQTAIIASETLEETRNARYNAQHQLVGIIPRGVELVIYSSLSVSISANFM